MATFPAHLPDLESSYERDELLNVAPFGDGYYQATGDGIRPYKDRWNMSFSNRPKIVIDEIETFLNTLSGASFLWKSPRSAVATSWKHLKGYSLGKSGPDAFSIEFVIEGVTL